MLSTNRATRPLSSKAFGFISEGRALASTCSDRSKRLSLHLENKTPPKNKRMSVDEIYLQSHEVDFQMAQFITQIKKVDPIRPPVTKTASSVTTPVSKSGPRPVTQPVAQPKTQPKTQSVTQSVTLKWKSAEKAQKKYVNDFEYEVVPRCAPNNKASFFSWFRNDVGGTSKMASSTWNELDHFDRQSLKEGHYDTDFKQYTQNITKAWSSIDILSKPKSKFGKFCVRNRAEILNGNAHLENNIPEYLMAAELKWREKKETQRAAKTRDTEKKEKEKEQGKSKQGQEKKAKKTKKHQQDDGLKDLEPIHKPSVKDIISQFESLSKGIGSLKPHSKKMKKAFKDALSKSAISHSTVQGVSRSVQMFESMTKA